MTTWQRFTTTGKIATNKELPLRALREAAFVYNIATNVRYDEFFWQKIDKALAFVAETLYNSLDKCRLHDKYERRRIK